MAKSQKKSGGTRKHGRNKIKCARYRMLRKREESHLRRIRRHIERYNDHSEMVKVALEKYQRLLK